MSRWHEDVGDAFAEVDCQGERHRIRWHRGRLRLEGHPDVAAEEALAALGGRRGRPGSPTPVLVTRRLSPVTRSPRSGVRPPSAP